MPVPGESIDLLVCKKYRPALERDYDIRFAPGAIAGLFSCELTLPRQPTFGFHGLSNMWRYTDDGVMLEIVNGLEPYVLRSVKIVILILNYSMACKYAMTERLFTIMQRHISRDDAIATFRRAIKAPHADALFSFCEELAAWP